MPARSRIIVLARLAWAATLVRYAREPRAGSDRRIVVVSARLLAAREVGEALATAAQRDGRAPRWSSWVDALHAATMVPVALLDVRLRRDALASGGVSALLALLSR